MDVSLVWRYDAGDAEGRGEKPPVIRPCLGGRDYSSVLELRRERAKGCRGGGFRVPAGTRVTPGAFTQSQSQSYFTTDGQSVSMSSCRAPLWGPWPDFTFSFLLSENCFSLLLGRPLWQEDGSAICSAVCQWSESRRTCNHTLLSPLRLLGSLSIASYDSQRLRQNEHLPKVKVKVTLRTTSPHYIAPARTAQKTSLPLTCFLTLLVIRVHSAVP
jgi:hypothetical protein